VDIIDQATEIVAAEDRAFAREIATDLLTSGHSRTMVTDTLRQNWPDIAVVRARDAVTGADCWALALPSVPGGSVLRTVLDLEEVS